MTMQMQTNFTSKQIEALLSQEAYSPVKRMDKRYITDAQKQEVNALENVVSFGQDSIDLFENMLNNMQTLPTQAQYVEAGLPLMINYLAGHRPDIIITETARQALVLRMTRTYMSKVIELHLEATFKDYLPHMTVRTYKLLDSVMGVDLVIEDDTKRYYVHVTSNTPFAKKMLIQKESRGGYRLGESYIRYSRDFKKDLVLAYDVHSETETTQLINGFPLFKPEYINTRFIIAKKQMSIGEPLTVKYSKLQHFKAWVWTYLQMDISSI